MANERGTNVDTPSFNGQADIASQVASTPNDTGQAGAAQAKVGYDLSQQFGGMADELTKIEAKKAGTIAGDDPTFRPTDIPTLRGQAFDQAAQDTYMNNLQIKTRYAINQAYEDYTLLPQDQKTPDVLQSNLQKIQQQTLQDDVFPSISPKFKETFDKLSFPYLRRAQDDHDVYVGDQAKAAFVGNEQSAAGNTVRLASLGTPDGDTAAQQELQGHSNLIDEQVNQGNISPVAGAKLKLGLQQNMLQARALAHFQALPDAQKAGYADKFAKGYGTGTTGLVNPQFGDEDAPLAFRNNNFTNIRDGAFAQSQPGYAGAENGFARFSTPEAALAAANKNLDSYAARGLNTVAGIVNRWSPPGENDTPALIASMARRTGFAPNQQVDMSDPATRSKLIGGLIAQETGKAPFTSDQIASALTGNPTNGLSPDSFRYVSNKMGQTLTALDSAADQDQKDALSEIGAAKKQMTAGFDLPPALWQNIQSKYAHSTDPEVLQALGQASQIRSYFAGFKGQTPQQIETAITNFQPEKTADGVFPQTVPVVQAMKGYLQKYRQDLATDPLRRAANEGVISNLAPIDFTKPQTIAAGLTARLPQADMTAARYGTEPTILLPDEKAQLKKVAAAGGQPMVDTAQAIVQALGPRAGQVFEQAAGDAPKFATVGRVAAWGGDPTFLHDFAERQRLTQDPAANKGLELPTKNATDPILNDTIGTALSQIPSMNSSVRQAARDVYEYRALGQNLDKTVAAPNANETFVRGIQQAAGATFDGDQQYGGIGNRKTGWFSSQKVLAPLGMKADRVGDAIDALTDKDLSSLKQPPVAGDLKTPIPASTLQGAQLTSVGHGVYAVSLGDPQGKQAQWVMSPNGQRFTLDLNQLEPTLRARRPDLYRSP